MLDDKNTEEQETPQEEATPVENTVEETVEQTKAVAEEVAEKVEEKTEEVATEVIEKVEEKAEAVTEEVTEKVEEKAEEVATEVAEKVEAATEEVAADAETATKVMVKAEESTEGVVKRTDHVQEDISKEEDNVELDVLVPTGETGEAHDDFDWDIGNQAIDPYTADERASMLAEFDKSMSAIKEGEIVSGIVTVMNAGDVILDINFKSDGLVSLSEFRDTPDLKVGDAVDVFVELQEDARGQLVLSRRKAKLLRAWDSIKDSYENGTIIKGTIVSKTKGGLIADCSGLETFLPGSQIDIKPIIDYDSYVGRTMEFRVVKINETIKNAVVSHKALIESDLAEQREQIIASLERGQVLEGLVKNITDFGAFLDLGGVDGLLYITDISWGRISHPSEILELNQKINVAVLDFDENKKRISLGLKQLQPHPWEVLTQEINEGSTVKGKIVNIEDYGAFLQHQAEFQGMHRSLQY